jgi:hypothetical protein
MLVWIVRVVKGFCKKPKREGCERKSFFGAFFFWVLVLSFDFASILGCITMPQKRLQRAARPQGWDTLVGKHYLISD